MRKNYKKVENFLKMGVGNKQISKGHSRFLRIKEII